MGKALENIDKALSAIDKALESKLDIVDWYDVTEARNTLLKVAAALRRKENANP